MFAALSFISALLSTVTLIEAKPTRRDDAFCTQLLTSCVNAGSNAVSDPWSIPACIYGATCFGGSRPVDGFLAAVAASKNVAAKASLDVPRVTVAVCALCRHLSSISMLRSRVRSSTKSAPMRKLSPSKILLTESTVLYLKPMGHTQMSPLSFLPSSVLLFGRPSAMALVFPSKISPITFNFQPPSTLMGAPQRRHRTYPYPCQLARSILSPVQQQRLLPFPYPP